MDERRDSQRVEAEISINLTLTDGTALTFGTVRNVSLGGVFVEMNDPLPAGSEIRMGFIMPTDETPILCRGIVKWVHASSSDGDFKSGIGVELCDLTETEKGRLSELLPK